MRASWAFVALFLSASTAHASEPWADADPDGPPERLAITESLGISGDAEYRAMYTHVNPIDVGSERNRRFNTLEHRGRVSGILDWEQLIKINVSLDLLDSVLWGDNGTFGGTPSSDIGIHSGARDPNVARSCVGLRDQNDPLSPSSYGYTLCEADPVKVRRLWGQANTPIGAIRVGRMPVSVGMGIQTANGDGRTNRFGVAYEGDQVDRVLFATKPLEALKPKELRDTSEDEGLIVAVMYDRWVSDLGRIFSDDVHQVAYAFRYLQSDFGVGSDLEVMVFHAHRWNQQYATSINTVGGRAIARFGGLHLGFDMAGNIGSTREVSEAYSLVSNDPIVDQEILQYGARAVVRYDWQPPERQRPMVSGYLEFDYASGDRDPQPRTPLTAFRFSEDTNVGLLMFEHVVRFQSARAAAAGVEIIRRLGAETFPAERVDTRGAFTNAIAIFPQLDIRPHDDVLFRGGVLVAWAATDVVDPVLSLQAKDGVTIEDDLVNFVGGKPGRFYGTEIDGRFQWRLLEHFALDLEAAVLFPGDALQNENGEAVTSFLTQGRTTFFF